MNYKYEGEIGQIEIKIEDGNEEVDDSLMAVPHVHGDIVR